MQKYKILDGKTLADNIKNNIKKYLANNNLSNKITLAVILVGNDPASEIYVKNKTVSCEYVGINTEKLLLPENTSIDHLTNLINKLNKDKNIHGILLQLPLPKKITANLTHEEINRLSNSILEKIDINKDVDGFHPYNIGRLAQKYPNIRPCTPKGIIKLLEHYKINIKSKNATIIGDSNIVGKPLALEILMAGGTVTICNKLTSDLKNHCINADLICTAVGIPNLIKAEFIKPGATIIDIGITRLPNGKLCGDVEFDKAIEIADYITPVPGGVGPMTVAMLLENTVKCYNIQKNNK